MTACLRLKLIHYFCSFSTVIKMSPICWWITNASLKRQPQECVLITSARESKDTHAEEAKRYYDMLEIVLVAWNVTLLSCRKWVRQYKTAENEIEKSDLNLKYWMAVTSKMKEARTRRGFEPALLCAVSQGNWHVNLQLNLDLILRCKRNQGSRFRCVLLQHVHCRDKYSYHV